MNVLNIATNSTEVDTCDNDGMDYVLENMHNELVEKAKSFYLPVIVESWDAVVDSCNHVDSVTLVVVLYFGSVLRTQMIIFVSFIIGSISLSSRQLYRTRLIISSFLLSETSFTLISREVIRERMNYTFPQ